MEIDGTYELDINPKKVCRLCLSQPTDLLNIYSSTIVDGYILSIPQILQYTVDISIAADDKLPSKICGQCKKQIVSFYTFKQKSKRTEESLLSMFSIDPLDDTQSHPTDDLISCSLCDAVCQGESTYVQHMQQEHPEHCNIQLKQSKSDDEFVEYEIVHDDQLLMLTESVSGTDDDTATVTETVAPKQARRTRAAAKAKQSTSSEPSGRRTRSSTQTTATVAASPKKITVISSDPIALEDSIEYAEDFEHEIVSSESDIFECQHCALQFLDKIEYLDHCKEHEQINFQCEMCSEIYVDEESLLLHECEVTEEDLICVPCNKRMKSIAQMRQHIKMHDSMSFIVNYVDFYPCHDCCLVFMGRERLLEHNVTVHGDRVPKDQLDGGSDGETFKKIDESCTDYQFLDELGEYRDETYACGECDVTGNTLSDLKYHVLQHSEKFQCPIFECGCQYDQLSRLTIHVLNKHINTKNLQCLHCNQAFPTYDELQAHIKHDCKEKKFSCFECDKKFFSQKALSTHLRTLKEKKYQCDHCGKTFKQQGELTIHKRSHTNERPFQCTICNKSYKTSSMRAAHMDSHISGKTFECTLCDKKLQSRTSYRNHMKRHTEEKKHECEYCGKRFFTRYHLRLHQSKIHKGSSANAIETENYEIMEDVVYE